MSRDLPDAADASPPGVIGAIRIDLVRLYRLWMAILFPRQHKSHSVLGKWRPETTLETAKYRVWGALGVVSLVALYPLALLGLATRFYARRIDRTAASIGLVGVVLASVLVWGLLTAVAQVRFAPRGFLAVAAAGVGGILAGVVVYGWGPTATFFSDVVVDRAETAAFVGGYPVDSTFYVTIQRPLSHLLWGAFPDAPPGLLTPLAGLVAAAVLAVFYLDVETRQDRLFAVFATLVVTITTVPALQWYLVLLFFPMVPLWYVWEGPGRRLFLVGGAVMFANETPGGIVSGLTEYGFPPPLESVFVAVATFASVPLYGIAIMLVAAALAKYGLRPDRRALEAVDRFRAAISSGRSGP